MNINFFVIDKNRSIFKDEKLFERIKRFLINNKVYNYNLIKRI